MSDPHSRFLFTEQIGKDLRRYEEETTIIINRLRQQGASDVFYRGVMRQCMRLMSFALSYDKSTPVMPDCGNGNRACCTPLSPHDGLFSSPYVHLPSSEPTSLPKYEQKNENMAKIAHIRPNYKNRMSVYDEYSYPPLSPKHVTHGFEVAKDNEKLEADVDKSYPYINYDDAAKEGEDFNESGEDDNGVGFFFGGSGSEDEYKDYEDHDSDYYNREIDYEDYDDDDSYDSDNNDDDYNSDDDDEDTSSSESTEESTKSSIPLNQDLSDPAVRRMVALQIYEMGGGTYALEFMEEMRTPSEVELRQFLDGIRETQTIPGQPTEFMQDFAAAEARAVRRVLNSGSPSRAGPSRAGPSRAGPSRAGPSRAGPSRAGPSRAGPSRAGPSRAGPSRAGPSRAGPSRAGPSRAGPARAAPVQGGRPADQVGQEAEQRLRSQYRTAGILRSEERQTYSPTGRSRRFFESSPENSSEPERSPEPERRPEPEAREELEPQVRERAAVWLNPRNFRTQGIQRSEEHQTFSPQIPFRRFFENDTGSVTEGSDLQQLHGTDSATVSAMNVGTSTGSATGTGTGTGSGAGSGAGSGTGYGSGSGAGSGTGARTGTTTGTTTGTETDPGLRPPRNAGGGNQPLLAFPQGQVDQGSSDDESSLEDFLGGGGAA